MQFIFFLVFLICGLILAHKNMDEPQFHIAKTEIYSKKPVFMSQKIPQPSFLRFSHSATITALSNGNLLALWFSGSKEGSPDVKIWQSEFIQNKWTLAHPIMSSYSLMHDLRFYVRKLGNPVIYRARNGILHLFVVSVSLGGWGGSSINHLTSSDNGNTWSKATKLITSPFINISTLVRCIPIELSDGGFYLPAYHEFIHTYPELLRFNAHGDFVEQHKISSYNSLLQPSIIAINSSTAYAYMRNNGHKNRNLYRLETHNGGVTWSDPVKTNLKNFDSSIAVNQIESGLLIMAYNPKMRGMLAIATSLDGLNWKQQKVIENYTGSDYAEFSYPSIIINNGVINMVYTWYMKGSPHLIKHIQFNKAWLLTP